MRESVPGLPSLDAEGLALLVEVAPFQAQAAGRLGFTVRLPTLALVESARRRAPAFECDPGSPRSSPSSGTGRARKGADDAFSRLPDPLPPSLLEATHLEAMVERAKATDARGFVLFLVVYVLLLGTGLVAGAIVYKTQRESLNERVDHWRLRLGEWE